MRPSATKVVVLAALFAAGVLLAAGVGSGQIGETTTTTTTTTTAPGTTVISTETVQQTTTRRVIVPTATTSTSSEKSGTPAWVWVLVGILAVALVVLIVLLARRGGGTPAPAPAEQRRRLDGAVATWAAQGWALESQTADSAVLRRGNERMLLGVDPAGNVTTRDLPSY
jgi:hypothetical protein